MPVEPSTVNAPEFPPELDWLNVSQPLSIRALRGKIVLLDFWTYCCINCMHVLSELQRLERKYKDDLVVIGVHSAKFTTEKETANIRQAVLRYGIEHPVVNDREMGVFQEYAVRAWPSLILIDPNGKVYGTHSGEGIYDLFDGVIAQMIERFDAEGTLDRRPLHELLLEREREPQGLLSFPGKVLADAESDRLFIADSGHQRIIVASLSGGDALDVIGSGEAGFADGAFAEARFQNPQGMALEGDLLYIADTDNHAIRRADLRSRIVVTLAGDGVQDLEFNNLPGRARGRRLNSPWDLTLAHGVLFVAMAGSHQIWGLDLEGGFIAGHAGSGDENHLDGPLLGAALAQPSGLTHDGSSLFVADSEVSSVRAVDLDPRGGHVKTLVGEGLFDFGDVDGVGSDVRLQHPLDVEYVEGTLFVADTYNHKIKTIGLATRTAKTVAGSGQAGLQDGSGEEALFNEPGGLSSANGKLYIADTNNHAVRTLDIVSGEVASLELRDPASLPRPAAPTRRLQSIAARPGAVRLHVSFALPEGAHLNDAAPSSLEVVNGGSIEARALEGSAEAEFDIELAPEGAELRIEPSIYYCIDGREQVCMLEARACELRLEADAGASGSVNVTIPVGERGASVAGSGPNV